MDPMDDDVAPNAYGSGFDIVPSLPSSMDAVQRHEQAVAQVAAMDPRVASEVHQQMLDSGGSVSLQEATQATLAGVPSATVTGAPTVNNMLAMTRSNVVNVNTTTVDEELRRELQQHEFQLSEQARMEAELEALRFRQLCKMFSKGLNNKTTLRSNGCKVHWKSSGSVSNNG